MFVAACGSPASGPTDGLIFLDQESSSTSDSSAAFAIFSTVPTTGPVVASDGLCAIHGPAPRVGFSAGEIHFIGTQAPMTLDESGSSPYVMYAGVTSGVYPLFDAGAQITVDANGGTDLPAFTATITAPPAFGGWTQPNAISRSGYMVTWTAAAGGQVEILLAAFPSSAQGPPTVIQCLVPDAGAFDVPATILSHVPASADQISVAIGRIAISSFVVDGATIQLQVLSDQAGGLSSLTP